MQLARVTSDPAEEDGTVKHSWKPRNEASRRDFPRAQRHQEARKKAAGNEVGARTTTYSVLMKPIQPAIIA